MPRARKGRGSWEGFTAGFVLWKDLKMSRTSPRIRVGEMEVGSSYSTNNSKFHSYCVCKLIFVECLFLNSIC